MMHLLLRGLALVAVILFSASVPAAASVPTHGPYKVESNIFNVSSLDSSDPSIVMVYPNNAPANATFPLLAYAHGAAGGGYYALWTQIASHGFVIAAPRSCSMGCKAGGWRTYYSEQLKTIDWVKNSSAMLPPKPFSLIDWTPGVGIVGHSMGGEATIRSAQAIYTRPRNIRAAMLHHPFVGPGDFGSKIAVPIAAFTGTADNICYPNETVKVFDAVPATVPKMLRNQVGIDHLEPVLIPPIENEYLGTYTAAWFKVWLLNETGDYKTMIYGNRANYSLCDSAPMAPNGCRFS
eukprot:gene13944-32501_t